MPILSNKKAAVLVTQQPEIFRLIASQDADKLSILLNDKRQAEIKNDNGQTPLIFACETDNNHAVKILLPLTENLNAEDFEANTAVIVASKKQNIGCLKLLLDAGADPNHANFSGRTALMIACAWVAEISVQILIQYGADVNRLDKQYRNALYYLQNSKKQHLFNLFKRRRINKLVGQKMDGKPPIDSSKNDPQLSFAEIVGKQANISLANTIGSLIAAHAGTLFFGIFLARYFLPQKMVIALMSCLFCYPSAVLFLP